MNMTFRPVTALSQAHPCVAARTFADAASSYVEHGGEEKYLARILPHMSGAYLDGIYPFDIRELAKELYPNHSNATLNRCVITPIRAVCYHAYDRGWGPLLRIRNFKQDPPTRKKAASQARIHAFVRQCDKDGLPHLAVLVMFMSQTAARVSEAIELRWAEVDILNRTALLLKTKTSVNSVRMLTDQAVARLYQMKEGVGPQERVFRYTCRHSVNERIKAVCRRADIIYKPSHTCGRHAFANNVLALGVDVKSAMDAGGWKSAGVFLGTYVNPRNAGRHVAERLNLYQYDAEL